MTLILQILFWIFMVLLGFLFLLFLLSLLPMKVFVSYRDETWALGLQYLWFSFDLTPKEKSKGAKQGKKPAKDEEEITEEPQKKGQPSIFKDFATIRELIGKARESTVKLLGRLKIRDVVFEMSVGTGNPVFTGVLFGQLSGVVYNFFNFCNALMDISYERVVTQPDFLREQIIVNFSCNIALRPIVAIVIGVQVGWMILKKWIKSKFGKKQVAGQPNQ